MWCSIEQSKKKKIAVKLQLHIVVTRAFHFMELAWSFYMWWKTKRRVPRLLLESWPARHSITSWSDTARWIVESQSEKWGHWFCHEISLLPDIYYLPAYVSQHVWSFLGRQFKPWQMRTLILRKNSGFCAFVRPWQLAFLSFHFCRSVVYKIVFL